MAIGKRIRFFRNRKGMTQKQLGEILGFLGKTSDVRMAQYESEARTPRISPSCFCVIPFRLRKKRIRLPIAIVMTSVIVIVIQLFMI